MRDVEDGKLKLAKVTKMQVKRIALCKRPAVPEAEFVLVKSADPEEQPIEETPATPDADVASSSEGGDHAADVVDDAAGSDVAKSTDANADVTEGDLSKSPQPANSGTPPWTFVDGEDAAAVQKSVAKLVETCNESKIVPQGVKALVGDIAKYHGVEGPDASDETVFSEFVAQMKALLPVMQQMVVAMAKAQPAPPAAAPPSPPSGGAAGSSKPAPAKKSEDVDGMAKETAEDETEMGDDEESESAGGKKKEKQKTADNAPAASDGDVKKDCSGPSAEMKPEQAKPEAVKKSVAPPEIIEQTMAKKKQVAALTKAALELQVVVKKALGKDPDYDYEKDEYPDEVTHAV